MGFGGKTQAKGSKGGSKTVKAKKSFVTKDGEGLLRVDPYGLYGKFTLRPYVEDGSPIFVGKGVKEKKFLTREKLVAHLDATNSEMCRRRRLPPQQRLHLRGAGGTSICAAPSAASSA